jgi:PAS domain S-box-containing protein
MEANGRKILVADDSALMAAMLSSSLKAAGYETITAVDGIQATQKVYSENPDLVVLDIYMPRMNGYQVCRLLRGDPAVADIPVVILTATEDPAAAEFWSLQTGADAFLTKRNDRQALVEIVTQLLDGRARRPSEEHAAPAPEDILARVSDLMDRELYQTTVQSRMLEAILSQLQEGILVLDMDGRVTQANPCVGEMLGMSTAELEQCAGVEAIGESGSGALVRQFDAALQGTTAPSEDTEVVNRVSGAVIPIALTVVPLQDHLGKIVGGICVLKDIKRRKEVEALNAQLTELDKVKQDLTHMIVHDLRTPMTSLITGLQTVELLGELNPDQTEFLQIALQGAQTLLGMVNDLLDISKMEDGSMTLEIAVVEPAHVVEAALSQVRQLAGQKKIQLATEIAEELPELRADEEKVRRALINLIGNALKFTPEGGRVTVRVKYNEAEQGLCFSVEDTGEGIPKEAFARIFEKFGQVENRKAGRKNSTGLGLTFCKMAVEAHGGRIWVESILGIGSTFSFTLPASPNQAS